MHFSGRADRLNAEVAQTLAEMGCFRLWIGSESGSQRILDAMERGVTVEQVHEAVSLCRSNGIQKSFHAGEHVIEIGCGTGTDACFLAERGVKVTACDNSSRMIEMAARKAKARGLQNLIDLRPLAAEELGSLQIGARFDGAFSNFGALNCVQDLPALVSELANILRPGATALLCWIGPYCLWEVIYYLFRRKPAKAFRRWHSSPVLARIGNETWIPVYYRSVPSLARTFSPQFRLKSIKGIGVSVPPSYLEPLANRFPSLLRLTALADFVLGRCPGVRTLADHVLLEFQRESP
jgi:ubiquinone/menaquinone biosynthesis C-methylase UbiE